MSKKKLWILSYLGVALTIIGDLLLGYLTYPEASDKMASLVLSCQQLSYARIGLGAFFGAVGIPLTYYGLEQFAVMLGQGSMKHPSRHRRVMHLGAIAMAFWGAAVHIVCAAAMLLMKIAYDDGFVPAKRTLMGVIPPEMLAPALWIAVPITAVFMVFYAVACGLLFVDVIAGKTILARWACVFNTLVCKIVLNALAGFMPNEPFFNGLRMCNMSLGALLLFVGFFIAGGLKMKDSSDQQAFASSTLCMARKGQKTSM